MLVLTLQLRRLCVQGDYTTSSKYQPLVVHRLSALTRLEALQVPPCSLNDGPEQQKLLWRSGAQGRGHPVFSRASAAILDIARLETLETTARLTVLHFCAHLFNRARDTVDLCKCVQLYSDVSQPCLMAIGPSCRPILCCCIRRPPPPAPPAGRAATLAGAPAAGPDAAGGVGAGAEHI